MQELYDALESAGAGFGYDSGTRSSNFSGRALAEDLPLLLNLLAETIQFPAFPKEQIERLRTQLLTGLAMRAQDTADMADLIFDELLFKGHPYGRPDDGWPETIQAITRKDLVDFHRRTVGPQGMVIAVVGAVEPKRAVEYVQRALGTWKNPAQKPLPELPPFAAITKKQTRHHKIEGKSQTDLVIGTTGPRRRDPDYMAASLGNSVLGQFGMGGRIGDAVREKAGLAYFAYSNLGAGYEVGTWDVSAGVNPKNVRKATDLILKELTSFVKKGVSRDELKDSQNNFIGRLPLSLESNSGIAGAMLNIERYELGWDYFERYSGLVSRITPDEVRGAAEKYINLDRLVFASAGP
jgi:zinc protease